MRKDTMLSEPARSGESPSTVSTGLFGELTLHRAEAAATFLADVAAVLAALGYTPRDCLGVRLAIEDPIVRGESDCMIG